MNGRTALWELSVSLPSSVSSRTSGASVGKRVGAISVGNMVGVIVGVAAVSPSGFRRLFGPESTRFGMAGELSDITKNEIDATADFPIFVVETTTNEMIAIIIRNNVTYIDRFDFEITEEKETFSTLSFSALSQSLNSSSHPSDKACPLNCCWKEIDANDSDIMLSSSSSLEGAVGMLRLPKLLLCTDP